MTSGNRDALLVDLDGTLLRGNSFHMWLRHILSGGLGTVGISARWRCRLLVLMATAMRAVRLIDHASWKYRLQAAWHLAMTDSRDFRQEIDGFLAVLKARIDRDLLDVIHEAQTNGAVAVMTTAAPSEYAAPLAGDLGFDEVVTTPAFREERWCHNIGEVKCRRTLDLLDEKKWLDRRRVLYTDHIDDLALIRESQEIFVVAASANDAERVGRLIPGDRVYRAWARKEGAV